MPHPRGRILLVIRRLGGRAGGAERLFCETANMFADAGYAVTAVTCERQELPPRYRLAPEVTRVNVWSRSPLGGLAWLYARARHPLLAPGDWLSKNLSFIRRLHAVVTELRPDVIISFLPPANTPSLIAGWLSGVSVVPTNHAVPAEDYRSPTRWDQNPVDRFLRLRMLRSAERVHVLFPAFASWFPEPIQAKVVAIPNAVSAEFLTPAPGTSRRKEILGVGRLVNTKNYAALLEAWALLAPRHPDWRVKIYGDGPERPALERRIRELGIEPTVNLMGQHDDIKAAYLGAEILCHPALFEGFGLSVAEALACGLPAVAFSDCTGVKELVREGDNGLLVDRGGGASALAQALERLMVDEPLRERMRRRAPDSVQPYSLDRFRERWTELVDGIIQERSTRAA